MLWLSNYIIIVLVFECLRKFWDWTYTTKRVTWFLGLYILYLMLNLKYFLMSLIFNSSNLAINTKTNWYKKPTKVFKVLYFIEVTTVLYNVGGGEGVKRLRHYLNSKWVIFIVFEDPDESDNKNGINALKQLCKNVLILVQNYTEKLKRQKKK